MSIYPVPLQKWFPNPKSRNLSDEEAWDASCQYYAAKITVKLSKCEKCGKHCKYNRAWGHHSIPWGYGEVWCSEKCLYGPKKRKKKGRKKKLRGRRKRIYKLWDKELIAILKKDEKSDYNFSQAASSK